ncbi:VOC family protein [Phenylobacterium sp.]|uniref:VOC family protein n=1 Tax=Phenylobacterium sp. TaxID=1871053 RepID=UPI0025EA1B1B|nr:VOC family protein [Phenylobacterium sp.]
MTLPGLSNLSLPQLGGGHPPLHHVGIVQMSEEDVQAMMAVLNLEEDYRGYVPEWHALCIFTKVSSGSPIEFVVPDGGPLLKFNKGMGGLHHIALEVEDLEATAAELAKQEMRLLEPKHVKGAGNFLCNFLSPVYTRGLTVEYVQVLPE